ncbi:MAG: hypothetical protein U0Z44_12800 [Kouleothrix sp.]
MLGAPVLRWAYAIERAGQLIDAGMAWPTPRRFDSLPAERDRAALEQALTYSRHSCATPAYAPPRVPADRRCMLPRAIGCARPRRTSARLPGRPITRRFAMRPAWSTRAPIRLGRTAAALDLTDRFAAGRLSAPGVLIKSLFCSDRGAESCYGPHQLSHAVRRPRGPLIAAPTIFLHSPASLSIDLTLPAEPAALRFVAGLDPAVREWASDGALLRVWVTPARGARARCRAGDRSRSRAAGLGAGLGRPFAVGRAGGAADARN